MTLDILLNLLFLDNLTHNILTIVQNHLAMINILLADDHKMFTEGVRSILEKDDELHILGEADNGEELLTLLDKNPHTHLVILDVEMPKMNGIEVAKTIRKTYPNTKILMLTYHNEGDYIYDLYRMGVDGYLIKNKTGDSLIDAIHSIVKYKNRPFPSMDSWGSPSTPYTDEEIQLTSREVEVLNLAHLTGKEIGKELGIGKTTVDTHLENMRKKFKVDTTSKLLRKAIRLGYIKA